MNLEVQWFISVLVGENLADMDLCQKIVNKLGQTADLGGFAQEYLDLSIANMNREQAETLLQRLQELLEYAAEKARSNVIPEMFAVQHPADYDLKTVPRLDKINDMSDEQLSALMINLLRKLREIGASDLHISAMAVPFIRKNLVIERLSERPVAPEEAMRINTILLTAEQKKTFEKDLDLNFVLEIEKERFRACLMIHKDGASGSYRLVPGKVLSLAQLGFLPRDATTVERLLDYHNGLILVTGPLGSGKTTTLAAMIDIMNHKREDHIITVEDPIEILQFSDKCNVTQRQLGEHTRTYHAALRGALREDPDIIVVGEMHDLETIEMAITASETGHLVIGTLHTCNAANTLNRVLDVFPPSQQPQIRTMTAGSLRGIVCQQLFPAANGGVTVGYELLLNTLAVSNIINEGKMHQLKAVMQTSSKQGMCTMDTTLYNKFKSGLITEKTALEYITDKTIIDQIKADVAATRKVGKK